jgi:hypothetical protein
VKRANVNVITIIKEERSAKRKKREVINAKAVMRVAAIIKRRTNMVNTRAKSSKIDIFEIQHFHSVVKHKLEFSDPWLFSCR